MSSVSNMIWETCKTYLLQQGKFLVLLWALIAACIVYYFYFLQAKSIGAVLVILASSVLGILGSYGVAWFGIRINTYANSRAAFASLRGNSLQTLMIPLRSGMSIGLLLVCVELVCMIGILLFMPPTLAGPVLHRLRHRRIARRGGAAHRRRHLHQDRRHRLGPDENCFQPAGR